MFSVKVDDLTLWSPIDNKLKIVSPNLNLEVNKIGSLSFKIYPDHPYFNRLEKMRSVISVHQGERTLFKGRIFSNKVNFQKVKTIEVEGILGYFNDSIVRSYTFKGSVADYFTMLVDQHNNQVEEFQRFKVGNVTVTDPNDYITREASNSPKTWDEINDKLIKLLGGYISIRYEDDGNYVDYLADYVDTSTQEVAFAVNLLDLTREGDANALATCIIPHGAKDEETGVPLDITSVNGGLDYVYDEEAVAKYGRIFEVVTWEDVTLPENLLTKAVAYLSNKVKLPSKFTIKAIDLHLTDSTIEAFKLGDYIKVYSEPHGIDERVLLTAYKMDLTNPSNCTITLGLEKTGFLESQIDNNRDNTNRVDIVHKEVGDLITAVSGNVKSVKVYYYLSTSATELVGGEWSENPPEWVDGRYYWQKTKTTHADGATAESTPVCITGARGASGSDGIAGKDGKDGEDGKTTYFHVKYAPVINPTAAQMVETPDKYIGTYVDFTEADSTDPSDYEWVKLQGEDGIAGENGIDGKTYYLHIRYSNDGGETFTANNGETTGTYIGVYTDMIEADSSDVSDYKWSLIKGGDGSDGVGVEEISTQFYLSTSQTELTGGSWGNVMPSWSVGLFLWIRSVITYSDGSIGYTEPVCDSSWTAIDDIEVGGRNYLRKTDVSKYFGDWIPWGSTLTLTNDGYILVTPTDGASGVGACPPKLSTIEAGKTYTVSFEAYAEDDIRMSYFYIMDDDGNKALDKSVDITTTPARYSFTFEASELFDNCSILFGYNTTSVDSPVAFCLRNPKLEIGNKPTDWTPAPEDNSFELEQYKQETYTYVNEAVENSEETTRTMLKEYVLTSNLETLREEVSLTVSQTAEDFNLQFDTVNERITEENGEIVRLLAEQSKYIRLVDGNIILGEVGALLTTKIANGRISFLYNDTIEVAYISDQKLYITNAEILDSIIIGNFGYIPRANGNLSFKKVR